MKSTQTLLATVILSTGLLSASGAYAALESRLGGLALYDTDLNLTWLANGNANGLMDWSTANAWASGLTVSGVSGWRLPTTLQPDATCGGQSGSASYGYNCTGSEMGHLFYNELGGVARQDITTTHNANYNLFHGNVESAVYWSGTEHARDPSYAWSFVLGYGSQGAFKKGDRQAALAVHPGDVAAVPVPAAAWLLGSGLLGLTGAARRRHGAA
ncbi:MAG: Lcl domain-containing protein [Gammaproteobacteria bacterium]